MNKKLLMPILASLLGIFILVGCTDTAKVDVTNNGQTISKAGVVSGPCAHKILGAKSNNRFLSLVAGIPWFSAANSVDIGTGLIISASTGKAPFAVDNFFHFLSSDATKDGNIYTLQQNGTELCLSLVGVNIATFGAPLL